MSDFVDHDPIPDPAGLKERFDRLEQRLDDQGRAIAFLLASVAKQPAQLTGLQELLDRLGREMPGPILNPLSIVGS